MTNINGDTILFSAYQTLIQCTKETLFTHMTFSSDDGITK